MRWGFGRGGPVRRRGGGKEGDPARAAGDGQSPEQAAPSDDAPQPGAERRGPERRNLEWRRLPPLGPTVQARPVLVAGPLLKLPDVTGTRPLIHLPTVARDAAGRISPLAVPRGTDSTVSTDTSSSDASSSAVSSAAAAGDAGTGRVSAVVVPRSTGSAAAAAEPPAQQQLPETPGEAPLIVHRRPVAQARPASAERRTLISVSEEYVGEPQAEQTPYASSAWLRMVEAYRPQQQFDGGDENPLSALSMPSTPSAPSAGGPSPDDLGFSRSENGQTLSWSSAAIGPPPGLPPAPRSPAPDPGADRPRRASLAESRRLGLGRPLPSGGPRDEQRSETSAATDRDVRPAPVRGAQAPGPGPDSTPGPAQGPVHRAAADRDARPVPPRSTPTPGPVHRAAAPAGPVRPAAPASDSPATEVPASGGAAPSTASGPDRAAANQSPEHPVAPRRLGLGAPISAPPAHRPRRPAADQRDWPSATSQAPFLHPAAPRPTADRADPPERPDQLVRSEQPEFRAVATYSAPSAGSVSIGEGPDSRAPARPVVSSPVYRASSPRRPAPRAAVLEPGRPEANELIHRSAPAPKDDAGYATRSAAVEPAPSDLSRPEPEPPAPPSFAPQDLADTLRRVYGMDVSDVPINRGPETAGEARSLDARAFTRDGEVFLPADAGPFERPDTRALLAHELTHAAQQRAFGPSLPSEDSPAGRVLEAQALAAEHGAHGTSYGSSPWGQSHLPLTHFPMAAAGSGPPARVQRAPEDLFDAPLGRDPLAYRESAQQADTGAGADTPQSAQDAWAPPRQAGPEADPELTAARGRLLELVEQRLLDLDDSSAIGELAEGLYPRIRLRLQHELLVARERTGTLSDLR